LEKCRSEVVKVEERRGEETRREEKKRRSKESHGNINFMTVLYYVM